MIVTALANRTRVDVPARPKPEVSATPRPRLVFIPPAAPLAPRPAVPQPLPTPPPRVADATRPRELILPRPETEPSPPEPTPKPDKLHDRISIGTADGRPQNRFSPDKDGPDGEPKAGRPGVAATPPPEAVGTEQAASAAMEALRRQRSRQGVGEQAVAPEEERSIAGSIARLEKRLGNLSPTGEGGAVRKMGPLFFDPQGADFTAWMNHWTNEIYRNWIVPQAVIFGFSSGHVDFEFTVERDGSLGSLRMLKSSGVRALDRAAENALRGARMRPLPADFRPPRVTMQVSFGYNEDPPQGS